MPPVGPFPQLDLTFAPDGAGVTRLVRRRVRYPYAFLKPFWFGDRPEGIATAILQSGSGGLFGGERLGQKVTLAPGGAAHVTTQAAAIVHARRDKPAALQQVRLHLAEGSHLEYLPEPMLLFPQSALVQDIAAVVAPDAVLLLGDGMVRHDPGPGDLAFDHFGSDLEVRLPDGRLLFADRTLVDGADFDLTMQGGGRRWRACGWFAAVAPDAARHAGLAGGLASALAQLAGPQDEGRLQAEAAPLPNGAGHWCRIVAADGSVLRSALRTFWRHCRVAMTGHPPPRDRK